MFELYQFLFILYNLECIFIRKVAISKTIVWYTKLSGENDS